MVGRSRGRARRKRHRHRGPSVLFNLDTACWALSVWDLTHLLHRAGTGANTHYTAAELAGLFPFTQTDVGAAVELRRVTSLIDQAHRDRGRLPAAA
ncbi:MAG TPA: hypothetical protein VLT34_06475 [Arthrobacter sp.]|nr:hypothetical protein [Arthrobacter sp.]